MQPGIIQIPARQSEESSINTWDIPQTILDVSRKASNFERKPAGRKPNTLKRNTMRFCTQQHKICNFTCH